MEREKRKRRGRRETVEGEEEGEREKRKRRGEEERNGKESIFTSL